jgi:hypothetical protein
MGRKSRALFRVWLRELLRWKASCVTDMSHSDLERCRGTYQTFGVRFSGPKVASLALLQRFKKLQPRPEGGQAVWPEFQSTEELRCVRRVL